MVVETHEEYTPQCAVLGVQRHRTFRFCNCLRHATNTQQQRSDASNSAKAHTTMHNQSIKPQMKPMTYACFRSADTAWPSIGCFLSCLASSSCCTAACSTASEASATGACAGVSACWGSFSSVQSLMSCSADRAPDWNCFSSLTPATAVPD